MNALEWLGSQNISYRLLHYPAEITTSSQAAIFLGIEQEQMLKSLLVKVGQEFLMILTPLTQRLDMNYLMKSFGVNKARMATADEVLAVTGYRVGTTCPFLLKASTRIFIAPSVLKYQDVAISSGEMGKEIMLSIGDLQKITQAIVLSF